jgi:hypothetical protein
MCLNAGASTTQSKTALASLLNTIPAEAASKLNLGSLGRFGFIALTEEKIRKALAARCKLFTLLEADHRYHRHLVHFYPGQVSSSYQGLLVLMLVNSLSHLSVAYYKDDPRLQETRVTQPGDRFKEVHAVFCC